MVSVSPEDYAQRASARPAAELEEVLIRLQEDHTLLSEAHHAAVAMQGMSIWWFLKDDHRVEVWSCHGETTFDVYESSLQAWKEGVQKLVAFSQSHPSLIWPHRIHR